KGKTMFMPAMSTAAKQIGDTPGAPSQAAEAAAGASAGENGGEKGKTMFMPAMSTAAKQMASDQAKVVSPAPMTDATTPVQANTPQDALERAAVSSGAQQQNSQQAAVPNPPDASEIKDVQPRKPIQVSSATRKTADVSPPGFEKNNLPLILGIAIPVGLVVIVLLLWLFVFSGK
ncbi:MAG: hypothetical protein GXP49_10735, partial [Deltaproteobacteria bacterium]|nr:hypothetical protein [Deltaproteobacteria bacterium]